jgi:hypothetical protein
MGLNDMGAANVHTVWAVMGYSIAFGLASTRLRQRCQVVLACATEPDALSAPNERVSTPPQILRPDPEMMARPAFTPGLSTPHLHAIEGGNQSTGAIDVPGSDPRPNDPSLMTRT